MNNAYRGIIRDIKAMGTFVNPRGEGVKELRVDKRKFDSTLPFADFEVRPFNWKYFAGELAWYLNKDTDVDYISQFSKFWQGLRNPGTNEINSNYGNLLFNDQLKWVIDSLRKDPNTRQAIAFLNQPKFQFEGNRDFVCTMYLNFWIRDNKLHMKVQMRSNDIFYGLTFDAPFFAFIHQHILHAVGGDLELGDYYHCADNIHYYDKHSDLAKEILDERLESTERLELKAPLFTYESGEFDLTPFGRRFVKEVTVALMEDMDQDGYKKLIRRYM